MLKKFLISGFVLSLSFSAICAELGFGIDEFLSSKKDSERVIVEFNDVSKSYSDNYMKFLQDNAKLSQKEFISEYSNRSDSIKSLWAVNAVSIDVNKEFLKEISNREDVKRIYVCPQLKLFSDSSVMRPVDGDGLVYGLKSMNVDRVWKDFNVTGKGVLAGVVDSGLNIEVPVFGDRIKGAMNFAGDKDNLTDKVGHGTHVSGTVLGNYADDDLYDLVWGMFWQKSGTFKGNIGVAPDAQLMFAKCADDEGNISFDDVIEGIQWMTDPDGNPETDDGCKVINASLGADESIPELREPLVNIQKSGVFLCFAAGNSGKKCGSPADFPEIFAVGAVDSSDNKASFSSIGPVQWDNKEFVKPDICAPGVKVISYYGEKLARVDGTSMASPNTAGVIALIYSVKPDITVDEVKSLIQRTSLDLGVSGPDNKYGAGRVDAYAAISELTGQNRFKSLLYKYNSVCNALINRVRDLKDDEESEKDYMNALTIKEDLLEKIIDNVKKDDDLLKVCHDVVMEGVNLEEVYNNLY